MKTIQLKNILTVLAILLTMAPAIAQTEGANEAKYNTGVSIRQQLMNGTAPGLKFAPASAMKSSVQQSRLAGKDESKRSLSEEIKNGTLGGLPVSGGGGKQTAFKTSAQPAKFANGNTQTASDLKPEVKKAPAAVTPSLPTQGDETAPVKKETIKSAVSVQGEKP